MMKHIKPSMDFQEKVRDFIEVNGLETSLAYRLADLVSEIGELAKALLKRTNYGREEFSSTANWEEELGDVLFSLVCLANSTNINLEKALDQALEKYNRRIGVGGSPDSDFEHLLGE